LHARDRLIVALDLEADDAIATARELAGVVRWVKVGMTLFYEEGPFIVERMLDLGFDVFLDLKLHDIPHQVQSAAERVARLGVGMLTVHASGGAPMIQAAARGAREGAARAGVEAPSLLAVTVLTSMDDATLATVGVERTAAAQVPLLAKLARGAGADGIVCSPQESAAMRGLLGADALIVTPGVRPAWAEAGDQSRIATPAGALTAGSSHLVVGRPITEAADPAEAAVTIISEMEGARS
jgi:orotidine-5'-phosphate decarboxylase